MVTEPPRRSASMCLLRASGDSSEVLLGRRGSAARFMPGAWVFPGGVVDPVDGSPQASAVLGEGIGPDHAPWLAAGARETLEESGIWLTDPPRVAGPVGRPAGPAVYEELAGAGASLALGGFAFLANWITPTMVPVRFDTRFYVGEIPDGVDGAPDGGEIEALRWVRPADAVADADRGTMLIAFPTRRILLQLAGLGKPADAVAHARSLPVVPVVQPRFRVDTDGSIRVLVPGDPGFDETPDLPPDPAAPAMAPRATGLDGEVVPELVRRAD